MQGKNVERDRKRRGRASTFQGGNHRAEAVYRATLAIATELSLDAALQKIVDAARELVSARYAALGVIDEERRRLTHFVVSGVTDEQVRAIEHWPRGLGLLGELIRFPHPLRVKDVSKDPRSIGFPPHHPFMTSFMGVPIIRGDRVLGNFYMTDKLGADEFTEADEEILSLFAAHAAIAIENARLYTETDIRLREKVVQVERAERRSRFLSDLGAVLLRLPPGEELPLGSIAERATEPLGDVAAIYLVEPNRPEIVATGVIFHHAPHRREAAAELLERSWNAIQEQILTTGKPILVADLEAGETTLGFDPQALTQARFSAALAVPIGTRRTNYGLFVSLASRPITFSKEDLRFAALIADRLGAALDSAFLYRRELEARAQVEQLAELAQHRASELETVLDTMTEAVYVFDSKMRLLRRNRAYDLLLGSGEGEPVVESLRQHFQLLKPRSENGKPLSYDQLPATHALRGESFTNSVMIITPIADSRGDRFLSLSGAPIRDAAGQIVAAVIVARDVTEAKEIDRLKDEFISVASHELKTPLTVVKGYAQILLQRLRSLPERATEIGMAQQILDQTNRMAILADRLLDVSRIQFGRLALEKQSVDLAALVREVAERMQVGIVNHPLRISIKEGIPVCIDTSRMEQVITNLLSNADKYSREGTEIDVALERHDARALLSVRDRGYGIPRDQQPYIFQRFYRASTGERKSGAGLGLYVSKGIVEAHGGRIWFDSKEGKGSTFYVELPVRDRC